MPYLPTQQWVPWFWSSTVFRKNNFYAASLPPEMSSPCQIRHDYTASQWDGERVCLNTREARCRAFCSLMLWTMGNKTWASTAENQLQCWLSPVVPWLTCFLKKPKNPPKTWTTVSACSSSQRSTGTHAFCTVLLLQKPLYGFFMWDSIHYVHYSIKLEIRSIIFGVSCVFFS